MSLEYRYKKMKALSTQMVYEHSELHVLYETMIQLRLGYNQVHRNILSQSHLEHVNQDELHLPPTSEEVQQAVRDSEFDPDPCAVTV